MIQKAIKDDVYDMKSSSVGGKDNYTVNGSFEKLNTRDGDKIVYVYQHAQHATCSGTTLTQLSQCGRFSCNHNREFIHKCENEEHHYALMPFFMGNDTVLKYYEFLKSKNDSLFDSQEIEELRSIVHDGKTSLNTSYISPPPNSFPNNWNENEWTLRLVPGIQKLFPTMKVMYTAEMGLSWHRKLVQQHLRADLALERHFLFTGSPDIVINKRTAILSSSSQSQEVDVSSSSDEDSCSLVENSRQPYPMQAFNKCDPPDKIGEVFGGLYILLVSKILRKIGKGKAVHREFKMKGLLVGKAYGGDRCILRVDFKDNGISKLDFDVTTFDTYLGPDTLCKLLEFLLD